MFNSCLVSLTTEHVLSEVRSHGGPQEGAGLELVNHSHTAVTAELILNQMFTDLKLTSAAVKVTDIKI